jgi:hypothetical protein
MLSPIENPLQIRSRRTIARLATELRVATIVICRKMEEKKRKELCVTSD